MSRTYRRTKNKPLKRVRTGEDEFIGVEWNSHQGGKIFHPPNSKKYQEDLRNFHSDHFSAAAFKEPGPSWFRNLYGNRPLRRDSKEELRKYMLDQEYDPMIPEKNKLPYWT